MWLRAGMFIFHKVAWAILICYAWVTRVKKNKMFNTCLELKNSSQATGTIDKLSSSQYYQWQYIWSLLLFNATQEYVVASDVEIDDIFMFVARMNVDCWTLSILARTRRGGMEQNLAHTGQLQLSNIVQVRMWFRVSGHLHCRNQPTPSPR